MGLFSGIKKLTDFMDNSIRDYSETFVPKRKCSEVVDQFMHLYEKAGMNNPKMQLVVDETQGNVRILKKDNATKKNNAIFKAANVTNILSGGQATKAEDVYVWIMAEIEFHEEKIIRMTLTAHMIQAEKNVKNIIKSLS